MQVFNTNFWEKLNGYVLTKVRLAPLLPSPFLREKGGEGFQNF